MDGLTDAVPTNREDAVIEQLSHGSDADPTFFDLFGDVFGDELSKENSNTKPEEITPLCAIYDWRDNESFKLASLKGGTFPMEKKFYAVIGNPPYQADKADNDRKPAIYNDFMDAAYEISDIVELVTPGRFLFDAGQTPKSWNEKMLADTHLKVLHYEQDSASVFPDTDIKGGIVITLRNVNASYGPIGTFTRNTVLNAILKKINEREGGGTSTRFDFRFTTLL